MKQIRPFVDQRIADSLHACAFCGGQTSTRDHCPSKVFLDKPYPIDLSVVPACRDCNTGFSADEEYLACLIQCVIAGSVSPDRMQRVRISKILKKKPSLRSRIAYSMSSVHGQVVFYSETKRVENVIIKLAKGHVLYEHAETVASEPNKILIFPLSVLSPDQLIEFEASNGGFAGWPEIGTRAMQRAATGHDLDIHGWLVVQLERYRFQVSKDEELEVKIVINEYLGAIVLWDLD